MSDEKKRVDEDWKKRAQLEKEQDAAKVGDRTAEGPAAAAAPAGRPARPASGAPPKNSPQFAQLVESLASQALMFMGAVRDPMTGQAHRDLHQAQAMIDLLTMLEEKTQGNLSPDEEEMFRQVLDEVRMTFVRMSSPPPPRSGPMMGNKPRE